MSEIKEKTNTIESMRKGVERAGVPLESQIPETIKKGVENATGPQEAQIPEMIRKGIENVAPKEMATGETFLQGIKNVAEYKITRKCPHLQDGAIKVAEYIVREIKTNVKSDTAKHIRGLIDIDSEEYKQKYQAWRNLPLWKQLLVEPPTINLAGASGLWLQTVMNESTWDHKPKIRNRFRADAVHRPINPPESLQMSESHFHKYKDYDYFYDVWSNIHYGYVGLSVGFTRGYLLLGSNLEQIVTDAFGGQDTRDDVTAIEIGFALYDTFGKEAVGLLAEDILNALERVPEKSAMSYSKQLHWCWHEYNNNKIPKPKESK